MKKFLQNHFTLAFFFGALANLAFAPFNFFIAAIISLSAFYFILEDPLPNPFTKSKFGKNTTFWLGFFFGFGHFLAGVYWIAISLFVDINQFFWLVPFAITLIPAALAVYIGTLAVSYKFLIKKYAVTKTYKKIIIFSLCWLLFEILRANLFTGFPWNLLGYIWMFDVTFAQSAGIFGIYGLSLFAVMICLLPVLFFKNFLKASHSTKFLRKVALGDKVFAGIMILLFFVNAVYGYQHLRNAKLKTDNKVKLRLVQANIKQEMKWDDREKFNNFRSHISLTNSPGFEKISAVIWSETSVPFIIDSNPELLAQLKRATPKNGFLITGGLRAENDGVNIVQAWNSVFTLAENGVVDIYDKHHLVPFGEYIPFQKFLPFIDKITNGSIGFSEGSGPKTIVLDDSSLNFSFSPLLCYEVIFSNEVVNKKLIPDLLVNLTNDAWFGNSSGPYQHFNMARMRAIEYGASLVRVAGTGISAYIDPLGRVVKKLGLNEGGILDVDLIRNGEPTLYSEYQNLVLILLVLLLSSALPSYGNFVMKLRSKIIKK